MTIISKFVLLSLFITLFYFIGLLTFITDHEENTCEMTYMFEYPQFVKIKVPIEDQLPRYGLYAYSEGKLTERARAMKFDGIPVLFVPGNSGSYKQVRSLASVALRKALHARVGYYFNFFTLDLNEELSGLNGAVLQDQTKFLNHSLYRILDLYDRTKPNVPTSVIVIGHSMGGVIAHSLLINPETAEHVDLLITLATPHKRPTICLDNLMADYYTQLAQKSKQYNYVLQEKTFITIGGGFHDHLVNTGLTNSNFSSVNAVGTTIPKVWLSMDHACIVWCKQFILATIRSLFDSIDPKTKQLSTDPNYRLSVFRHHLLKNSGTNIRWAERYKVTTKLDDRGEWKEDLRRQYSVSLPKGSQGNQWHLIRIINDPKHTALFVEALNLPLTDWIFACAADSIKGQSRYCENGIHLSQVSKIAPSVNNIKRRTHYIHLERLKQRYPQITHIAVRLIPSAESATVHVDVHNPQDRVINLQLPRWFSLSRTNVITQTDPEAMRYEINLTGLQHVIQTYLFYVEPIECSTATHQATISFSIPWANHDSHTFVTETTKKPLPIRLHNSRPLQRSNVTAKIILTLDPACQYTVSVRNSFVGMLGQFVRFYTPLLVANIAAVILMSYRSQLTSLEENGYCTLFQSSLSMSTKPYYLITSAKLISKALTLVKIPGIPLPDSQVLIDENLDFLIMPLLLYVISVGLTYLFSLLLWAGIIMNESTVHRIVGKFFTRTLGGTFKMSEWAVNAMHRVPCVVAATLACLGLTTCGSLALCLGLAYYFLKLTQLCQDCLEGLAYGYAKAFALKIVRKFFKKKGGKTEENKKEETQKNVKITENKLKEKNIQPVPETSAVFNKGDCDTNSENKAKDDVDREQENEENNLRMRKNVADKQNKTDNENKIARENTNNKIENIENKTEEKQDCHGNSIDHSEMHFHFSLFLLWFVVAALNVPSVLTWAHNFQYNNILSPDPSFAFGFILCFCAIPLWQLEFPKTNKKYYQHISLFVYIMAMLCLIYGPLNVYRTSYFLTLTIVVTILHQFLAPNKPEEEVEEDDEDETVDPISMMNDIKNKME